MAGNWYQGRPVNESNSSAGDQEFWYQGQPLSDTSEGDVGLSGTTIASAESFDIGVVAGPVTGSSPIATAESFDVGTVEGSYQILGGVLSIPSAEQFDIGVVAGPVTGSSPIATAESFSLGEVQYDQAITPGSTIATAEAFDIGTVAYLLTGSTIPTAEAFTAGSLAFGITGYDTIASAESFPRGGTVSRDSGFQLFIRGLDRSAWLSVGTMEISEELGGGCSASFELITTRRGLYRPSPYDEVVYMFGGFRKFGGFVQDYEEGVFDGRSDLRIKVRCVDYRQLAEDRTFSKTYTGPTFSAKAIIKEVWEATLRQEGVTWNEGAAEDVTVTGTRFLLNDESVSSCFDKIATAFGMTWRITRFRVLRFERTSWELAPRTIRDNDGHTRNLIVKRSSAYNRTRQGIRTGSPVTGQRQTTLPGNGTHAYQLNHAVIGKPQVSVNNVAAEVINWDDRTLYPWDFAWERNSSLIRHNPAQAAYTASDEIVIQSGADTLDVFWTSDQPAIERLAQRTGGSGIVEVVRNALHVRDKSTALALAYSEFEKKGGLAETLTWEEDEYLSDSPRFHGRTNWQVGQIVQVFRSAPLVAGMFVVHGMRMQEVGGTFLRYSITAGAKELPLITGVEVDAEDRTVTITVDRPVGIDPGSEITIWGGGGLEAIWGNPTINTGGIDGSSGSTVTFTLPSEIDPGDLSYYGGMGGVEGGPGFSPIDGGLGTNGFGGTEEPFGGVIFSGIPPTGGPLPAPGGGTGIGQPTDGVVIDVNKATNEVTLNQAHGWSTSYPSGTFRVCIFGVRGCDAPNGSTINNPTTRITVTGATTFIAEDVGDISGAEGFINDGHGRAISTENIVRVTPGVSTGGGLREGWASQEPISETDDKATFLLASAIPGVASRPLSTGQNVTNPWIKQGFASSVVTSVTANFEHPPTGSDIHMDIKKNGTSIFSDTFIYPYIGTSSGGGGSPVTVTSGFSENPLTLSPGDELTIDVNQVGSDFPGCNGTVILNSK